MPDHADVGVESMLQRSPAPEGRESRDAGASVDAATGVGSAAAFAVQGAAGERDILMQNFYVVNMSGWYNSGR